SSFGLSGTNAHVVIEQPPAEPALPSPAPPTGPVTAVGSAPAVASDAAAVPGAEDAGTPHAAVPWVLSGRTAEAVKAQAERLHTYLTEHPELSSADIGHSL
ncbi:hypothetical protein G3M55_12720, partial [Streptomyces sp. SID8455]|nr:hypothetical protein [Streptomyces sp. SID8455]